MASSGEYYSLIASWLFFLMTYTLSIAFLSIAGGLKLACKMELRMLDYF